MKIVQCKDVTIKDNTIKGLATVELPDAMGDIVRVAGIDLSRHTDKSPIKVLANHVSSAQGKPTVIGKIATWTKTTTPMNGQDVPALEFTMEFAPTDLAKEYKQMVEGGFIDSFSIGFYGEGKAIYDESKNYVGTDFTKSTIIEVSLVSIPANQYATIIKALELKDSPAVDKLCETMDKFIRTVTKQVENVNIKVDGVVKSVHDIEQVVDVLSLEKELGNEADDPESKVQPQDDMMKQLADVLRKNK